MAVFMFDRVRLNLHACTRACVYLGSIEREQEQQCVSV